MLIQRRRSEPRGLWRYSPWAVSLSLALLSPACKPSDPPIAVGSVKKLGGAPARVLKVAFSGDGRDVLVAERRSTDAGDWGLDDKYGLTKRPVAGGESVELVTTDKAIVHFVPFGDGAFYVEQRAWPASLPDRPGAPNDKGEVLKMLVKQRASARRDALLREVHPGRSPTARNGSDERVFGLAGAADGQWVAYSLSGSKTLDDPADAEVHVISAKDGNETVLTRTGVVYDISPGGSRVLLLRRFPESGAKGAPEIPAQPVFDSTAVVLVDVAANSSLTLPSSIQVDGADVRTDGLAVRLTTTGLLFSSKAGDVYRCELDGTKAVRVAGPSSAPTSPSASASAPSPSASTSGSPAPESAVAGLIRLTDSRGTVHEIRDDGPAIEVSRAAGDNAHPKVVSARLEAPLSAIGPAAIDATGTRLAFAVISDTSRDGRTSAVDDDAVVLVSDPTKGSLAIERAQTGLLADELRPKVASALSVPAEKVQITHAGRQLEVTVDLPLNDGDKAQAVMDRWMKAAVALRRTVPMLPAIRRVRVGPFEALVPSQREDATTSTITALGRMFQDPSVSKLVHHDPSLTTIAGGAFPRTLTGTFENKGAEPLGPIEIVVTAKPFTPGVPDPDAKRVRKTIGPIEPGKKLAYKLTIWEVQYGPDFDVDYLIGGKSVVPLNMFAMEDNLDILGAALAIYNEHGVVVENDHPGGRGLSVVRVRLTEKHEAMTDAERKPMMERAVRAIEKHYARYHRDFSPEVRFLGPSGRGWMLVQGRVGHFNNESEVDEKP